MVRWARPRSWRRSQAIAPALHAVRQRASGTARGFAVGDAAAQGDEPPLAGAGLAGRGAGHHFQCVENGTQLFRHARAGAGSHPRRIDRGLAAGARHAPAAGERASAVQEADRGQAGRVRSLCGAAGGASGGGGVSIVGRLARAMGACCWRSGRRAAGRRSSWSCSPRTGFHPSPGARAPCARTRPAPCCWASSTRAWCDDLGILGFVVARPVARCSGNGRPHRDRLR